MTSVIAATSSNSNPLDLLGPSSSSNMSRDSILRGGTEAGGGGPPHGASTTTNAGVALMHPPPDEEGSEETGSSSNKEATTTATNRDGDEERLSGRESGSPHETVSSSTGGGPASTSVKPSPLCSFDMPDAFCTPMLTTPQLGGNGQHHHSNPLHVSVLSTSNVTLGLSHTPKKPSTPSSTKLRPREHDEEEAPHPATTTISNSSAGGRPRTRPPSESQADRIHLPTIRGLLSSLSTEDEHLPPPTQQQQARSGASPSSTRTSTQALAPALLMDDDQHSSSGPPDSSTSSSSAPQLPLLLPQRQQQTHRGRRLVGSSSPSSNLVSPSAGVNSVAAAQQSAASGILSINALTLQEDAIPRLGSRDGLSSVDSTHLAAPSNRGHHYHHHHHQILMTQFSPPSEETFQLSTAGGSPIPSHTPLEPPSSQSVAKSPFHRKILLGEHAQHQRPQSFASSSQLGPASPTSTAGPESHYETHFAVVSAQRQINSLQQKCQSQQSHIEALMESLVALHACVRGLKGSLDIIEAGKATEGSLRELQTTSEVATQTLLVLGGAGSSGDIISSSSGQSFEVPYQVSLSVETRTLESYSVAAAPSETAEAAAFSVQSTEEGALEAARQMQNFAEYWATKAVSYSNGELPSNSTLLTGPLPHLANAAFVPSQVAQLHRVGGGNASGDDEIDDATFRSTWLQSFGGSAVVGGSASLLGATNNSNTAAALLLSATNGSSLQSEGASAVEQTYSCPPPLQQLAGSILPRTMSDVAMSSADEQSPNSPTRISSIGGGEQDDNRQRGQHMTSTTPGLPRSLMQQQFRSVRRVGSGDFLHPLLHVTDGTSPPFPPSHIDGSYQFRPRSESQFSAGSLHSVDSAASLIPGRGGHNNMANTHRSVYTTRRMEKTVDEFTGIKSLNQYVLMSTIGQGSCGKVKLAFSLERNTSVAIKIARRGGGGRFKGGLVSSPPSSTTPQPLPTGVEVVPPQTLQAKGTSPIFQPSSGAGTPESRLTPEQSLSPSFVGGADGSAGGVGELSPTSGLMPHQHQGQHHRSSTGSGGGAAVASSGHGSGGTSPVPSVASIPFLGRAIPQMDQKELALRREIAIMKKLRHKNIVALFEVIDDPAAEKLYLVMQFIDRGCIGSVRPDGTCERLSLHQVLQLTRQVAAGIDYLHQHGIVHRDIKPENILYSSEERYFITDFGVSDLQTTTTTAAGGPSPFEYASKRAGTRQFMAPELFASTPLLPSAPSAVSTEYNKQQREASSHKSSSTSRAQPRGSSTAAKKSLSIAPAIDVWALAVSVLALVSGRLPAFALNVAAQDAPAVELQDTIDQTVKEVMQQICNHTFLEYEDPTPASATSQQHAILSSPHQAALGSGGKSAGAGAYAVQQRQIETVCKDFGNLLTHMLQYHPGDRASIASVRTTCKSVLRVLDVVREHHAKACRKLAAQIAESNGGGVTTYGSRQNMRTLRPSPPNPQQQQGTTGGVEEESSPHLHHHAHRTVSWAPAVGGVVVVDGLPSSSALGTTPSTRADNNSLATNHNSSQQQQAAHGTPNNSSLKSDAMGHAAPTEGSLSLSGFVPVENRQFTEQPGEGSSLVAGASQSRSGGSSQEVVVHQGTRVQFNATPSFPPTEREDAFGGGGGVSLLKATTSSSPQLHLSPSMMSSEGAAAVSGFSLSHNAAAPSAERDDDQTFFPSKLVDSNPQKADDSDDEDNEDEEDDDVSPDHLVGLTPQDLANALSTKHIIRISAPISPPPAASSSTSSQQYHHLGSAYQSSLYLHQQQQQQQNQQYHQHTRSHSDGTHQGASSYRTSPHQQRLVSVDHTATTAHHNNTTRQYHNKTSPFHQMSGLLPHQQQQESTRASIVSLVSVAGSPAVTPHFSQVQPQWNSSLPSQQHAGQTASAGHHHRHAQPHEHQSAPPNPRTPTPTTTNDSYSPLLSQQASSPMLSHLRGIVSVPSPTMVQPANVHSTTKRTFAAAAAEMAPSEPSTPMQLSEGSPMSSPDKSLSSVRRSQPLVAVGQGGHMPLPPVHSRADMNDHNKPTEEELPSASHQQQHMSPRGQFLEANTPRTIAPLSSLLLVSQPVTIKRTSLDRLERSETVAPLWEEGSFDDTMKSRSEREASSNDTMRLNHNSSGEDILPCHT
ncbi:protein kinase, putative [Bodo saltans]|uniref:Protein kinase, putative n=1 Tax=Bodo saltans TaxID=75058 RepID=A0A0S4IRN1_BODSA|nr:protein kinase, putative [Bodo saltans]|eukprot:CUF38816.1 protein kinase, putative [Bodo saltans]